MTILLVPSRLVLALVFAVAGVAKLADPVGSRRAMMDFGVPRFLATKLSVLLPLIELGVSVALLPARSAWFAVCCALALLIVFTIGIGVSLALGRRPQCHCFGQLTSHRLGWSTLLRNLVLVAVASLLTLQGPDGIGPSALAWLVDLRTLEHLSPVRVILVLGVGTCVLWLLIRLMAERGRLRMRPEGLQAALGRDEDETRLLTNRVRQASVAGLSIGTRAPPFRLNNLEGHTIALDHLLAAAKPVLLIFTHPRCGPCKELMPDLYRWQRDFRAQVTVAIISQGRPQANWSKGSPHRSGNVLLQESDEVAQTYRAFGTPSAVLVRSDGTIGSGLVQGTEAIRALLGETLNAQTPTPAPSGRSIGSVKSGPKVGDVAPSLQLPDVSGKLVDVTLFRGAPILLIFWNPACGFCQRMLRDLQAWESDQRAGKPKLVVISSGPIEANEAMRLHSLVLLAPTFHTARAFGATGTPSAVLVDADYRIASKVGTGSDEVGALLRNCQQDIESDHGGTLNAISSVRTSVNRRRALLVSFVGLLRTAVLGTFPLAAFAARAQAFNCHVACLAAGYRGRDLKQCEFICKQCPKKGTDVCAVKYGPGPRTVLCCPIEKPFCCPLASEDRMGKYCTDLNEMTNCGGCAIPCDFSNDMCCAGTCCRITDHLCCDNKCIYTGPGGYHCCSSPGGPYACQDGHDCCVDSQGAAECCRPTEYCSPSDGCQPKP